MNMYLLPLASRVFLSQFIHLFVPDNKIKVMYNTLTSINSHLLWCRHPFVPNALNIHQIKHRYLHVCGQLEESSILSGKKDDLWLLWLNAYLHVYLSLYHKLNHSRWQKYSVLEFFFVGDLQDINVIMTFVFLHMSISLLFKTDI